MRDTAPTWTPAKPASMCVELLGRHARNCEGAIILCGRGRHDKVAQYVRTLLWNRVLRCRQTKDGEGNVR